MKKNNLLSLLGVFALILTGCKTPADSSSVNQESTPSQEQSSSSSEESISSEESVSNVESSSSEESSPSDNTAELLALYKEEKIAEVNNFVSLQDYRSDEQALIEEALSTAVVFINSAATEAEVDEVVASYKAAVGSLKTNQQYEEEYQQQLTAAKETAKTSVNNVAFDELNYYIEEAETIANAKQLAISNIETATSEAELTTIVANYESLVSSTLTKEQYKQKNKVNFGVGGEASWSINYRNKTYTSMSSADALLMFENEEFTGGTIEWDMMIPSDNYAYGTVCGVVFGANSNTIQSSQPEEKYYVYGRRASEVYVGYSKIGSEFAWENAVQLNNINVGKGNVGHYKLEWERENGAVTLSINGQTSARYYPNRQFDGKYIGLYSEVAGTEFSNIKITPKTYEVEKYINAVDWTIATENNETIYTCNKNVTTLTLADKKFTNGTIEWDMYVPHNGYTFNTLCGIVLSSNTKIIDYNHSTYYVVGRSFADTFVCYGKYRAADNSVQFAWQDHCGQHYGIAAATWQHYKLTMNDGVITITYNNTDVVITTNLNVPTGSTIGLYAEVEGTMFKNIVVTSAE